jgi:methyl-accepting chemotaxis protein
MRVVFDMSEPLRSLAERLLEAWCEGQTLENWRFEAIMAAIDNLRQQVNAVQTSYADGQAAINSALEELAEDIRNLPANADVQAEADRLASSVDTIRTASADFESRIRAAVPTSSPTEPLPPAEPEPGTPPPAEEPPTSEPTEPGTGEGGEPV